MRHGTVNRLILGMFIFASLVLGYDLIYKEFTRPKAIGLGFLMAGVILIAVSNLQDLLKRS